MPELFTNFATACHYDNLRKNATDEQGMFIYSERMPYYIRKYITFLNHLDDNVSSKFLTLRLYVIYKFCFITFFIL